MDNMEEKINSILGNPQMMQQLMSMAQALGSQSQESGVSQGKDPSPNTPLPDMRLLQQMSGLTQQGSIDAQQRELLKALSPYLSNTRISKLEKAMRAAKMARIASLALGQKG